MTRPPLANYDARILSGDRRARADAKQVRTNGKAVTRLSLRIGPGADIDIDPLTGTPDQVVGRSALTGPSGRSAASVALGYVQRRTWPPSASSAPTSPPS